MANTKQLKLPSLIVRKATAVCEFVPEVLQRKRSWSRDHAFQKNQPLVQQ